MSRNCISSLPQAFAIIKEMNLSPEWDSDYRLAVRKALVHILEDRMEERLARYLQEMGRRLSDRRNGYFSRHLLTEIGDIELSVPRTRRWSTVEVVRAYARRVDQLERMILACFVLGLSTRKAAHALMPVFGGSGERHHGKPGCQGAGYRCRIFSQAPIETKLPLPHF